MKKCLKMVFVFLCAVSLAGCEEEEKEKQVYLMLEGSPEISASVKEMLEKNPQITESILGSEFIVKIIPPDTSIDHKITIIKPDPDLDFKIRIINPYGKAPSPELAEKLNEAIRKRIERFKKP